MLQQTFLPEAFSAIGMLWIRTEFCLFMQPKSTSKLFHIQLHMLHVNHVQRVYTNKTENSNLISSKFCFGVTFFYHFLWYTETYFRVLKQVFEMHIERRKDHLDEVRMHPYDTVLLIIP